MGRATIVRRLLRLLLRAATLLLLVLLVAAGVQYWRTRQVREALYGALAPIEIANCQLRRFGNSNDGGYLFCGNLLDAAQSAYSYGINGEDAWGCDVAAPRNIPLHQYDCFNTTEPSCPGGFTPRFHAECIGPERASIDGRPFDTFANQIAANGDAGKRLVVKMDVEGSEWKSLATAPDHVLNAIEQMAVEFHEVEDPSFLETAARLNEFFVVANLHINNYSCGPGFDPFPGEVFEVLLVNKRIAVATPRVDARRSSPLDAPNAMGRPDCQQLQRGSEPTRIARWLRRYARSAAVATRNLTSEAGAMIRGALR